MLDIDTLVIFCKFRFKTFYYNFILPPMYSWFFLGVIKFLVNYFALFMIIFYCTAISSSTSASDDFILTIWLFMIEKISDEKLSILTLDVFILDIILLRVCKW